MNTIYQLKNGDSVVMETQCRHLEVALDEFVDQYPNFYNLGYSVSIKQD
jgi:hypothetical protein